MTSKMFRGLTAPLSGHKITSCASSRGERTHDTCSAASRGHNNHCHDTRDTFCALWRAHRSPGTSKSPEWTRACFHFGSSRAVLATWRTASGHAVASTPAICLCQGGQSTSSTTLDVSTRCTSAKHSRQGDAPRWRAPALASSARSEARPTRSRHVCVGSPPVHAHSLPEQPTAPHIQALPHSSPAQECEGESVAPSADKTAGTSVVALWHLLAWYHVFRSKQRAVGLT